MEFITFSIVIPAHNEEKYIERTLKRVSSLNYPHNSFEIILVENGSKDDTLINSRKIKSKLIKIYSLKRSGISLAKNFGANKIKKNSEWIIFLDADTILDKNALLEINKYLLENKQSNLTIGTTRILPIEKGRIISFWFWFYNFINKNYNASMCLQIAKRSYFNKIKYDENLKLLEDFKLINELKRFGSFFYIPIREVHSSARRIKKVGGLKLALQWLIPAIIPYNLRVKRSYEVIR